ncbi:hypothetical protein CEXT_673751 [Caerostris extrusa]|uniref:Uncharacterized protein n=1 Tax=Caerostris extrusa TaxID=172846 RepID=A0AAV4X8H0_CAEEX|nr:hypothetical protein CEXT_673751 [Caerostris extrusa]
MEMHLAALERREKEKNLHTDWMKAHSRLRSILQECAFWSVCANDVDTSTNEHTTDYQINSVNEDFYTTYGERKYTAEKNIERNDSAFRKCR